MEDLYQYALSDNGKNIIFAQKSIIHGNGLFTNVALSPATILCRRLGLRAPLSLRDKRAIIGVDGIDPATPEDIMFKYINHSCNPNAVFTDSGCLISTARLAADCEITIDYNGLLKGTDWQMPCLCGEATCIGTIGAPNK